MASPFDSTWDALAAKMDDAVDVTLGDRILYVAAGVTAFPGMESTEIDGNTFAILPGFIVIESDGDSGVDELDEILAIRKRVKISRRYVAQPHQSHRLRHPELGKGNFRPLGAVPENGGRYWLFDVQKAS